MIFNSNENIQIVPSSRFSHICLRLFNLIPYEVLSMPIVRGYLERCTIVTLNHFYECQTENSCQI